MPNERLLKLGTRRCRSNHCFTTASWLIAVCGGASFAALGSSARADDNPAFLQWFETTWRTIEYRMPDFFMAGYDSTWLPPCWKAADPTSAGFDVFDRFDLGSPESPTAYGTEDSMRAMIAEFHRAGGLVYVDLIMNHNSGRNGSTQFHNEGGYPGFAMRIGSDFWGDFHDGSTQSTNPNDPNYNLWEGDLVGLIDIAHGKNYRYIRQPIADGNPDNIPAGTIRNRPSLNNRRFYPDLQLTPRTVTNTALPPGDPLRIVDLYPWNLANPMAGDPVMENQNDYLIRSTRWMMDVMKIDGFRLDAAKHIPQWFWNNIWDTSVHMGRITAEGRVKGQEIRVTPFSFGEIVDGNAFTQSYTRKDAFANRDALDLNGAGQLRNLLNAQGLGSWDNVLSAHLDTIDGGGDTLNHSGNNGSLGVNHVYSHDNGSTGDGGSRPPLPGPDRYALPQHAYLLFRPGPSIIYHHSREFHDLYQFRGFWPREGNPTALGLFNDDLTKLVRLSNGYARGDLFIINFTDPQNQSRADVLIFERRKNSLGTSGANVLVGVNDSYSNGVQVRNVQTSFPPGTRLHELTGNAADPLIDPNNDIPELLVVDANRRVTIAVPNNRNASGVAHHKGYVIYGPAAPTGEIAIPEATGTLPADSASVPSYRRRLTPISVITTPSFTLRLTTSKTDPLDPDWDDFAAFRFNEGFVDLNGNGNHDFAASDPYLAGFEQFLTTSQPLFTNPALNNGLYEQIIDTSPLPEGYNYILVKAFRRRPAGTDPIYADIRKVVYIDRAPPPVELIDATAPISTPIVTLRVRALDRTTNSVHILINPPMGSDPLTLVNSTNIAGQHDRSEWRRTVSGLTSGANRVVVVAFEATGTSNVIEYNVNVTIGSGDINRDGVVNIEDLYAGYAALGGPYDPVADLNSDGVFNITDLRLLENALRPMELDRMAKPQR